MKLEEARVLRTALDYAIARAETAQSDEVDLQGMLDAQLGGAIDELKAAIHAMPQQGG